MQRLDARQDRVSRLGKGRVVVPVRPTSGQFEPYSQFRRCLAHGIVNVGVGVHILVVDHGRGTRPEVLDQAQRRGSTRCISVDLASCRPDAVPQPVEEGLVVSQSPQERLEEVCVPVHHARHHGASRDVDHRLSAATSREWRLAGTNPGYHGAVHQDPARVVDGVPVIDRHDRPALQER